RRLRPGPRGSSRWGREKAEAPALPVPRARDRACARPWRRCPRGGGPGSRGRGSRGPRTRRADRTSSCLQTSLFLHQRVSEFLRLGNGNEGKKAQEEEEEKAKQEEGAQKDRAVDVGRAVHRPARRQKVLRLRGDDQEESLEP